MQFLVICRPAAGGDPDEFVRLVPFETETMREQKAAARILAGFPLVEADLITTEIIPLHAIEL